MNRGVFSILNMIGFFRQLLAGAVCRVVADGVTQTPAISNITYTYDSLVRMNVVSDLVGVVSALRADYFYLANYSDLIASRTTDPGLRFLACFGFDRNLTRALPTIRQWMDHACGTISQCLTCEGLITPCDDRLIAPSLSKYTYDNDVGGRRTSVKTTRLRVKASAFSVIRRDKSPWAVEIAFMTSVVDWTRRESTLLPDKVGVMFNLYNYPPSFRERELRRKSFFSELIGANRYFGDDLEDTGDPVGLQSFGYAYDNIGNRTSVTSVSSVVNYSPNNLNQYTQRQISNLINLRGSAETGATVTVKMGSSQSESVTRQEKYWHKQLTSTNDTEAQYPLIKVVGVAKNAATNGDDIVTIETGHVFVAKTPEQFTYDEDGNLLTDGRWEYTWNGENRLASMETATNKVGTTVPVVRLEFVYDYQGRRASKTVYSWSGTNWTEDTETTFLYDAWNMIKEEGRTVPGEPSCETNINYFVFGLDLSGSLQGAGGVGGLLAEIDDGDVYFPCFDANGNVSEYVSTNGTIVAHREYSPYGKTIVSSGTKKADFTHWFSTKPLDTTSGLYSYIFRYYDPAVGRWICNDPQGLSGGFNLLAMVANGPIDRIDYLGMGDNDVPGCVTCPAPNPSPGPPPPMPPERNPCNDDEKMARSDFQNNIGLLALWHRVDHSEEWFNYFAFTFDCNSDEKADSARIAMVKTSSSDIKLIYSDANPAPVDGNPKYACGGGTHKVSVQTRIFVKDYPQDAWSVLKQFVVVCYKCKCDKECIK